MSTTQTYVLPGATSFADPGNFDSGRNTVRAIGQGGNGGLRVATTRGGGGGGAGAYATSTNVNPSFPVSCTVGSGTSVTASTAAQKTSFGTFVIADHGLGRTASSGTGATAGGSGGLVANCTPTVGAAAGGGGFLPAGGTSTGGGGGGSGGPHGAGTASADTTGQAADLSNTASVAGSVNGNSGTQFDGSHGCGGGGGGSTVSGNTVGTGGSYGGGGGGRHAGAATASVAGGGGLISVSYTPLWKGSGAIAGAGTVVVDSTVTIVDWTFNVHYGLSAWSNHTFTLGERCSNASNAYQCTTAGTSTSAPTGTGSSINNGGAAVFKWLSAIDYTSLSTWAAAMPATQNRNYTVYLWNNGAITTTAGTAYFNATWTVSGSVRTLITPAAGESFRDQTGIPLYYDATKGVTFLLPSSAGSVNYFNAGMTNVTFKGIQFKDPFATSNSTILQIAGGGQIRDCIFDGFAQSSGAYIIAFTGAVTMTNNLVVDRAATTANPPVGTQSSGSNSQIVGNTIYAVNGTHAAGDGIDTNTATGVVCRNNAIFGYLIAIGGSSTGANSAGNCCTDATAVLTAPAWGTDLGGNLVSKTAANQFVNVASDFHLKNGADCIGAGATDTTNNPDSDDIFGTARDATWDIGANEYVFITYSAVVTIAGAGTVTDSAILTEVATSAIAGAGAVTDSAILTEVATGAIAGAGTVNTLAALREVAQPNAIAGAGTVTETETVTMSSMALAIPGAGTVNSSAILLERATSAIAGAGTVTDSAILTEVATVAIAGAGTVTDSAILNEVATVAIAGAGTVTDSAILTEVATATISGAGTVSTRGDLLIPGVPNTIPGAGTVNTVGSLIEVAQPGAVAGAGTVVVTGGLLIPDTAAIAGAGTVNSSGILQEVATASVVGQGTVNSSGILNEGGSSTIAGAGTVSVFGGLLIPDTMAVSGAGTVIEHDFCMFTSLPLSIAGAGTVSVFGGLLVPAVATIPGAGTVVEHDICVFTSLPLAINGTGTVTVSAEKAGVQTAEATINGAGTVTEQDTVVATSLPIAIAGTGLVVVSAIELEVARPNAIAGIGSVVVTAGELLPTLTTIAGAGLVTVSSTQLEIARPNAIAGAGSVAVVSSAQLVAALAIAGSGTITVDTIVQRGGVDVTVNPIVGAGAVSVGTILTAAASGSLAGQGGVVVTSGLIAAAGASLAGLGSVAAPPGVVLAATALAVAGTGAVAVSSGAVLAGAGAVVAGSGAVVVATALQAVSGAQIDGAGTVHVDAQVASLGSAEAAINGAGHVAVAASVIVAAEVVAISGHGQFASDGAVVFPLPSPVRTVTQATQGRTVQSGRAARVVSDVTNTRQTGGEASSRVVYGDSKRIVKRE